jgi:hypothetical protein
METYNAPVHSRGNSSEAIDWAAPPLMYGTPAEAKSNYIFLLEPKIQVAPRRRQT